VKILLFGASGHARVVADIAESLGWKIAVVVDDDPSRAGMRFCDAPVVGSSSRLAELRGEVASALVGIGAAKPRLEKARLLLSLGYELPVAVHPRATVSPRAVLEPGVVVMAGAVVNPGARIGFCAVVNTSASVDHDCRVGDGAQIAPGARLAGNVSVGSEAFVGIGSSVIEGLTIGARAIVGAGAAVIRNVPDDVVVVGVPARAVVRS